MQIIQHRKTYFIVSGLLVAASILAVFIFGFRLGIDFTGGSLMQIKVDDKVRANSSEIQTLLTRDKRPLETVLVQPTQDNGYILRFKAVSEEEHQAILSALRLELGKKLPAEDNATSTAGQIKATDSKGRPITVAIEPTTDNPPLTKGGTGGVVEEQFESIGPTIGQELKRKSLYAIAAVLIAIILYIAYAFRKVSQPVASWKYGVVAVVALTHDVIIPTGIFVVLGKILGVEIDILFITALLTILGFSVHDTIVVFDRTRENLARSRHTHSFEDIVNRSVNETIRRSINTSATAFLALAAVFVFGGESVKYFVLALMLGIIFGTYSSIFIASPLLVVWDKWSRGRR